MMDFYKPDLSDLTIIFVLDPPGLTRDSIILLSTIRKMLGDVKVIAYMPEEKAEFLFPYVVEFYDRMGTEIRTFSAKDRFSPPYKQGNKLLACLQPRETEYTLFLDTDTIIAAPFSRTDLVQQGGVSVVPEGVQGWGGNPGSWEYVYEKFGLPFPKERVELVRSRKLVPPYFNAGMIAFPTHSDFAKNWHRVATELDADPQVKYKRPWLDQIALPIAIRTSGLEARVLGREWNLSISHPGQPEFHASFFHSVNCINAQIVHFHQFKFFTGTRYLPLVDTAVAAHTCYASLADLMAQASQRQTERARIWGRFVELKKLADKTPEQLAELRELSRQKNLFKELTRQPELLKVQMPASIVKPARGQQTASPPPSSL